ncbi:MAG TPA: GAF domain-containing protein, partial [Bdellovibrio sp.]|nr:GAF domain-containing protein [Bdellovibrio sp.]
MQTPLQLFLKWQKAIRGCAEADNATLDFQGVQEKIVTKLGQLLNVDHCYAFQVQNGQAQAPEHEYRSKSALTSAIGQVPPWSTCPFLLQCSRQEFIAVSDTLDEESVIQQPEWLSLFKERSIRGFLACPVIIKGQIASVLILQTVQPRSWAPEE